MKYKILGAALALAGLYLIAKYKFHFVGLVFMLVGLYLAMKKGMKPE